jgi:hypothetical protein
LAITFRFNYPIERTMAFEREYHPKLRLALEDKRALLRSRSAIAIWMLDGGKLVGETYGVPWNGKDDLIGFPPDPEAIYCYSNTILSKYQGKGYGAILKAAFIGRVSRDFKRIYGHGDPARARNSIRSSVRKWDRHIKTGLAPARTIESMFYSSANKPRAHL